MKDKKFIMEVLQDNYNLLTNRGYEVLGVFLYGSQNYDLQYEDSDIDCKAIVLQSFNDFVKGDNNLANEVIKLENGNQIEVKEIRLMNSYLLKQRFNFMEILFTEYKIINKKYKQEWDKIAIS